ncbi:MAG: 3-phosphoserine/phosphohydroxythreonine transaminase [Flavobacteriales bacterium]|nr:3-phosphoserine/phosphohydroxythreonine transaminase [Flavobacteriales bacterium]
MSKVHNFSAGPCILPPEVLKGAADAVNQFNTLNLSLIEVSHRGKDFIAVAEKATSLVRELLNVPDGYSIVFVQGGASTQFLMTPYNFLKEGGTAAYTNTGTWAAKAIKEAKLFGDINVVGSSEDKNYNYIPKGYSIPEDVDYFHITSNNTIYGTQVKDFPETNVPVVCDMSSDIFSKVIDVSKFDVIYAGAQKNMGTAGATLAIVKDSFMESSGRVIPSMMNYKLHASKESMYNTPPVFAIYVSMLMLQWMKDVGGVAKIEEMNIAKGKLMYAEIDRNSMFTGVVVEEDRSDMNATFILNDDSKKEEFDAMWNAAGISGIKGHRDVGGYRASMYNALPLESVQALVDVMKEFESKNA